LRKSRGFVKENFLWPSTARPPRGRSLGAYALSQQPNSGGRDHRAAARTPCVTVIFLSPGLQFEIPVQPSLVAGGDVWIFCTLLRTAGAQPALARGSVIGLSYQSKCRPLQSQSTATGSALRVIPAHVRSQAVGTPLGRVPRITSLVAAIVTVFAMILQLPSRQFQGRLSATSGALVDGTIVALSFAAAPPLGQVATAFAATTTLSTWSRTHPPKERHRSPLMR
jgi:hypothetical protein